MLLQCLSRSLSQDCAALSPAMRCKTDLQTCSYPCKSNMQQIVVSNSRMVLHMLTRQHYMKPQ